MTPWLKIVACSLQQTFTASYPLEEYQQHFERQEMHSILANIIIRLFYRLEKLSEDFYSSLHIL